MVYSVSGLAAWTPSPALSTGWGADCRHRKIGNLLGEAISLPMGMVLGDQGLVAEVLWRLATLASNRVTLYVESLAAAHRSHRSINTHGSYSISRDS